MAFGWLGTFREGQWIALRKFLLEQRRDVGNRVVVIQNELERIGSITVLYDRTDAGQPTEKRKGFLVSPQGSSIHKLIQAYIVQGGNPLDLSLFLRPGQSHVLQEGETVSWQPSGGAAYPKNGDMSNTVSGAGYLSVSQYTPERTLGRNTLSTPKQRFEHADTLARRYVVKEIRYLRNDLEERILKLCDLREQLETELRETLVQAVGGTVRGLPQFDDEQFEPKNLVAHIVAEIDAVLWVRDPATLTVDPQQPNTNALADYPNIMADSPDEDWTAL